MKSLKQIENDPRVYEVIRNPEWSPESAEDYPDDHPPKYILNLNDGWCFYDDTHIAGADTVAELNELLKEIVEE